METLILFLLIFSRQSEFIKPSDKVINDVISRLEQESLLNYDTNFIDREIKRQQVFNLDIAFYLADKNSRQANNYYGESDPESVQSFTIPVPAPYKKRLADKRHKVEFSAIRCLDVGSFIIVQINENETESKRVLISVKDDSIKELRVTQIVE